MSNSPTGRLNALHYVKIQNIRIHSEEAQQIKEAFLEQHPELKTLHASTNYSDIEARILSQ